MTQLFHKSAGLVSLALFFMFAGCANWNVQYPNSEANLQNSIIVKKGTERIEVAAVEFGELGSYHDPSQIEQAEKMIHAQKRPLVVTYIHGWHNNIRSADVARFKDFLTRLARTDTVVNHHFDVVGVYIAWNGESGMLPIVNALTIWDRKNAAERLASNGDCLDALLRVGRAARETNPTEHYNFYLGHSLGGLILERAIAHTILTDRHSGVDDLPWNLAIMLNPASDAVLTRQLMASMYARYTFKDGKFVTDDGGQAIPENRPTIVELTSDNDSATGKIFPISAALAEIGHWRWPRVVVPWGANGGTESATVSELKFHRTTPGNSRFLVNYQVGKAPGEPFPHPGGRTNIPNRAFDTNLAHDIPERTFFTSAERDYPNEDQRVRRKEKEEKIVENWKAWQISQTHGTPDEGGVPWAGPHVPFWNARVDPWLIDQHGGIWSDNCMAMLAAIFRMHVPKGQESAPPPPVHHEGTKPIPPFNSDRIQSQGVLKAL